MGKIVLLRRLGQWHESARIPSVFLTISALFYSFLNLKNRCEILNVYRANACDTSSEVGVINAPNRA